MYSYMIIFAPIVISLLISTILFLYLIYIFNEMGSEYIRYNGRITGRTRVYININRQHMKKIYIN